MTKHRGGARAGGIESGIPLRSQSDLPLVYQSNALLLAAPQREAELQLLLRELVGAVARRLLLDVDPSLRSSDESAFLYECTRDRRAASTETLARLLNIQKRGEIKHFLSSQVRAIESRDLQTPCWTEASRLETQSNGLLNDAQEAAWRERTPVRLKHVAELAERQEYASAVLAISAHQAARTLQ